MIRAFLYGIGFTLLLGACTQRLICPAYQSAFIYDKQALKKKFSYLSEDSTPRRILTASTSKSNRYLVAVPESYRKKFRKMQTVEMKPVYPVIPDSLKEEKGAEFLLAESDPSDSAAVGKEPVDSVYAITRTKEKYNLDQDIYMWYFRDMLVLPDVRVAMEQKDNTARGSDAKTVDKKSKGGFFSNLFKKKKAAPLDSAAVGNNPTGQAKPKDTPKKRGGLFKKKAADPIDKKKEDGDGF
jgi:hypothetical protein